MESRGGTIKIMVKFIAEILYSLPHGDDGRQYFFTMDNLHSHHSEKIRNMIKVAVHRLAFRALYWAVPGPIEYVFNTIKLLLIINILEFKIRTI